MSEDIGNELRDIISAEVDKTESESASELGQEGPHSPSPTPEPAEDTPVSPTQADPKPDDAHAPKPEEQAGTFGQKETAEQARARMDRPPQSWRGEGKQHWNELPLIARQEIHRREQDMQTTMREYSSAKEVIGSLEQVLSPHLGWMSAEGQHPMQVIGQMFQAEALFRTGTPQQKVAFAADYLMNYNVDLALLDKALSQRLNGQPQQVQQPNYEQMVNQAVEQRLAPIFQQQEQQQHDYLQGSVNQFTQQPGHEYFEDLRHDMANVLDMASMRGVPMDLSKAYNTALAMRPDLQQKINLKGRQQSSTQLREAAQSISGSTQNPQLNQQVDPSNIRALLEANFGGT